ncbi:TolC family protein [Polluticoccus soli]|uniref:TolC family protein n=1 Tax=Polluticoccus soli TaxID=3034150 RepID=UPI0023E0B00F|nr:TolC family protein [Flavipsychrobacter sp. JY13-12]
MRRLSFILLLIGFGAQAQERLTLEDAIARALEHNYDIRIADVAADQATVNNTWGNAGALPNINGNAGLNVASTNSETQFANGTEQIRKGARSTAYNGSIDLDWRLFDGGRMFLTKRQLNMQEDLAHMQLKEQVQRTVSQVIQAYAEVVWQKQQAITIDTALALATTRMVLSQVKYETGTSAKVDYLQARVDYNARQFDSLYREAAFNNSFASLNALMGTDPYATFDVDDSLQIDTTLQPTDHTRLQGENLTLDVFRRSAQISKLNSRIAKTYYLPTLDLSSAYNYNYSKSEAGFSLFNKSSGPSAGLDLSVPIFQGGNIRRQARVASLQSMRDQLLYERQNTELGRQYRTAWRNYEVSVDAYRLERQSILYARENMDIQRARFRVGIATTLETREAENGYVQALTRLNTAAYTLKVNETVVRELENQLVH